MTLVDKSWVNWSSYFSDSAGCNIFTSAVGIEALIEVINFDRYEAYYLSLPGFYVFELKLSDEDIPILLNPSGVISLLTKDAFDITGLLALLKCYSLRWSYDRSIS